MRRALIFALAVGCSSPSGDCGTVAVNAQTQSEERLEFHRTGCTADSDCTLVTPVLSCFKGCPSAVRAVERDDALAELDALSSTVCGSGGCSTSAGCLPAMAKCKSGKCRTVEPVDGGDGGAGDGGVRDGG